MNSDKSAPSVASVLGTFGIFVLGTILGAVLENQFDSWFLNHVINSQLNILATVLFALVLIISLLLLLLTSTRQLSERVGIKVRYIDKESSGKVFKSAADVIKNAEETIYIVNSYVLTTGSQGDTPESMAERKQYYNLLLQKAQAGVTYERILQVQPGDEKLHDTANDPAYFEHLNKMLDVQARVREAKIALYKSEATRLASFILVDHKHLIWEIDEVNTGPNKPLSLGLHGAFVIHDPMKRITPHFIMLFEKLRARNKGRIEYKDLHGANS